MHIDQGGFSSFVEQVEKEQNQVPIDGKQHNSLAF